MEMLIPPEDQEGYWVTEVVVRSAMVLSSIGSVRFFSSIGQKPFWSLENQPEALVGDL